MLTEPLNCIWFTGSLTVLLLQTGQRQAKRGRTGTTFADSDHPAHAQSIMRAFTLHSYIL